MNNHTIFKHKLAQLVKLAEQKSMAMCFAQTMVHGTRCVHGTVQYAV